MAKSAAERKAAQRKRQREAGFVIPQWQVESEEHEMMMRDLSARLRNYPIVVVVNVVNGYQ